MTVILSLLNPNLNKNLNIFTILALLQVLNFRFIIFIILLVFVLSLKAQKRYSLRISTLDSAGKEGFILPKYNNLYDNTGTRVHELHTVLFTLYDEGYLSATIDSIVQDSMNMHAWLKHGDVFHWVNLYRGNADEAALSQTGYRDKLYSNRTFNNKELSLLMNKLLSWYENNGYPFASIRLDSIRVNKDRISATISVMKKQEEKIDSIVITGSFKIAPAYLYGYLGIKTGDLYNESKMKSMEQRLRTLLFLTETKPVQIIFVKDKAKIYLYLDKRPSDQINGIIGILPEPNGKINLTGDISLNLINSFHRAEEIGFHWQHTQPLTENLNIHFTYPYFLNTPLGVDEDFTLFKQDTTYLQIDEKIGLKYLFTGGDYFKIYYEDISTTLLSTSSLQNVTSGLPSYADESSGLYGIEVKTRTLDYLYNPRRGYDLLFNMAVGTRNIYKNPALNADIYSGLQLSSTVYKLNLDGSYYIPYPQRCAIKLELKGGYIDSPSLLYNDLYRIGGFTTLRGFDEQSIYASQYAVGTVELHYLLEQNSFLFLFFDQGWYRRIVADGANNAQDSPYGFGAGMDFQTKAGIFSISYALGKQFSNPVDFSQGKISFGLVNYF